MMEEFNAENIPDFNIFNLNELDVLLHQILKYTKELLQSEGGTIYIKENDFLKFHVFQNDALSYENVYKYYYKSRDLKLPLLEKGKYLAVDSFLNEKIIMVDDIYNTSEYEFSGSKEFDLKFQYKTHSVITVPLIHPIEKITVGVIQLVNKKVDGSTIPFIEKDKEVLSMFGSFIALSIYKAQNDLEVVNSLNKKLLEINVNLEKKVKEEVIENQKKSAIIFHQSKMASMGEMLSNIAHQWRQPLSTISTIASGISMDLQFDVLDKEPTIDKLSNIVKITKNLSIVIDDFRNFYNVDKIKEEFKISEAITRCLELAEVVMINDKIAISTNLDSSMSIYGLKNEFIQAILNVLIASKDLLVKNVHEKRYIFIDLYEENSKKVLVIKDNSIGISKDLEERIFKTDFLYELSDEALDNGLFMTKLIIEKHFSGEICLNKASYTYNQDSLEGEEFKIILP